MRRIAAAVTIVVLAMSTVVGCTSSSAKKSAKGKCGLTKGSVTAPKPIRGQDDALQPAGDRFTATSSTVNVVPASDETAAYYSADGVGVMSRAGMVTWSLRGQVSGMTVADGSLVARVGSSLATIGLAHGDVYSCVHDENTLVSTTSSDPRADAEAMTSNSAPDLVDDQVTRVSSRPPAAAQPGDTPTTFVEQLDLPNSTDNPTSGSQFDTIGGAFGRWALAGATDGFAVLGGQQHTSPSSTYLQLAFIGTPRGAHSSSGTVSAAADSAPDSTIRNYDGPVGVAVRGATWTGVRVLGVASDGRVIVQDVYADGNGAAGGFAVLNDRGDVQWMGAPAAAAAFMGSGVLSAVVEGGALRLTQRNNAGKTTATANVAAPITGADGATTRMFAQGTQTWIRVGAAVVYVYTGGATLTRTTVFKAPSGVQIVSVVVGQNSADAAVLVNGINRSVSLVSGA